MKRFTFKGVFPDVNMIKNNLLIHSTIEINESIINKGDANFLTIKHNETPSQLFELLTNFYSFGSNLFKDPQTHLDQIKQNLGTIYINVFDQNNQEELIETWTLVGVWPHAVNFGELCYSSDDKIELEITWGFNDYFIKFH